MTRHVPLCNLQWHLAACLCEHCSAPRPSIFSSWRISPPSASAWLLGVLPECLLATPQGGQGGAQPPPGKHLGACLQVLQMGAGPQRAAGDLSAMATPDRQLHMMGGEWERAQPGALSTNTTQQAIVLQPTKAAEQATSVADGQILSPLQAAIVAELPWPRTGRTVHTVCTSNGSPYLNFQTRVM